MLTTFWWVDFPAPNFFSFFLVSVETVDEDVFFFPQKFQVEWWQAIFNMHRLE